jgi:hypothetical protein
MKPLMTKETKGMNEPWVARPPCAPMYKAATPATYGAAIEVPDNKA